MEGREIKKKNGFIVIIDICAPSILYSVSLCFVCVSLCALSSPIPDADTAAAIMRIRFASMRVHIHHSLINFRGTNSDQF